MARGRGSSGEKRATPRGGTASNDSEQGYYISLFMKTGYVHLGYDSDELESGFTSLQDAIVRADAAVAAGPWVRAVVSREDADPVVALYDTAPDAPDARDAAARAAAHMSPRRPDEPYLDNDWNVVSPELGMRMSLRTLHELAKRQENGDDCAADASDEYEEEEEEEGEELLEMTDFGIRCEWRGGTTIKTYTGAVVEEIEIAEPTAICADAAMRAYLDAQQATGSGDTLSL